MIQQSLLDGDDFRALQLEAQVLLGVTRPPLGRVVLSPLLSVIYRFTTEE